MIKRLGFRRSLTVALLGLMAALGAGLRAQTTGPQQLQFAGLRAAGHHGQFNAVAMDAAGNLYLLLDEKDGVRLLKTDASATNILNQAFFGTAGDSGVAMALDPSGNIYVTGTSSSGALAATPGAAFPAPVGTTVNTFVARLDPSLNLNFLTFGGSGRTAVSGIAATADAVFVTGLIYGSGLPVTASAIMQAPANGSSQNGFVEKFSATGTALLYATYLTGQGGDTSPGVIAADAGDNAYVAGFTTSTGYPTLAALIPRLLGGGTSGFLTKLTPAGDGIIFSTFIPGEGISSIAIDPFAQNLLLSGSVALGQFPVASVAAPLLNTPYQVLLRMPLDGSSVLSSTVIAPGIQSFLTPGAAGVVWVDGTLSAPILPLAPIGSIGSGFAVRVSPAGPVGQAIVDQTARFGGLPAANPAYASIPVALTSVAVDSAGSAVFAGSVAPTASASLLATQTFDLPLLDAPSTTLPSSVRDAVLPAGSCTGSLCAGTAAYLARLTPIAGPSLALSTDALPTLILRNLGSTQANGLTLFSNGYALTTSCGASLASGDECTIVLGAGGPGKLTIQASNASSQSFNLAAIAPGTPANPLAFAPKEIDFGVQTGGGPLLTRTITVTNLTQQTQSFTSTGPIFQGHGTPPTPPFSESSSDCATGSLNTTKQLLPGATCHVTISFLASSDSTKDGPVQTNWTIGAGSVLLTGFQQAASLTLSATTVDFGTQFYGGLHTSRYLYLSNHSAAAIAHTPVALPGNSPFTLTDACAAQMQPHTVCRLQLDYQSTVPTSSDSTTLTLDQGLSAIVSGVTIPQPGVVGTGSNPTLAVTPSVIGFSNAVVVSGVSSSSQTVTIQNTGASSFGLALALTGDFTDQSSCGASLAGGASCSVVLTFAPAQPGNRTGLLSVTAGSTAPVYVTLSGTATPILPANNGTLDFGNITVGQPSVQWYKVSQPLSSLTAGTSDPAFKVVLVEDLGYGHGAPSSASFLTATTGSCLNCWLGVQFTPAVAGPVGATLALASTPSGNPYTLSLTGNGLSQAGILLTPATQDFGSVTINSSSAPLAFTLTNLGVAATPITVSAPVLTGDFTLAPPASGGNTGCGAALSPGGACTLSVIFAPTATGQRTGSLTLATSAGSAVSTLTGFGAPDPGIAFNPSALIFNNVGGLTATVQTVTVTNTGSNTAQIGVPVNASSSFTSSSTCTALAPGANCTLTVTFMPSTATVTDTIQLPVTIVAGGNTVVSTYTIPLSGTYTTASSGLQIVPGTSDYGPSSVNAPANARTFTINNLTAKTLALNVNIPREFVLSGSPCSSLAPNATCTVSVTFLPITNGEIPGSLYVTGSPSDASALVAGIGYLKGYGNGLNTLGITGSISPGRSVDFGQVPSGQTAQQVLTLTNTSSATVSTASSTVTIHRITSQWPFLSTTTCGSTLAIGQSCTVTVTYSPLNQVAPGAVSSTTTDGGTLTIESDATSGPDQITLAGAATPASVAAPSGLTPQPSLTASQNSLTFGAISIGNSSAPSVIHLTNSGNTTVHISGVTASSDFTVAGACTVLLPGADCTLTIAFAPQISSQASVPAAGARLGTLEISSDSTTSLDFVSLLGTASPSTLVFTPTALNFGAQLVGTTAALPVSVMNSGSVPATFNGITTTGDYAATGSCPAAGGTLAGSASCTIQVGFTPSVTGVRTGSLSIASSTSSLPLTLAVTGVGVQSHLSINPSALAFGSVNVGAATSLSVILANTGTSAITGVALKATGDYAITSPCSFISLSAGASCSVTVTFSPTAGGTRSGGLTITSSDPSTPVTLPLSGSGIAVVVPGSFTLTVNGGASASQTIQQAYAASYTLALTPLSGFSGTVVLSCSAVTAAVYASCSIPTSSLTLSGASQSATVTINTLASAGLRQPAVRLRSPNPITLCVLAPAVLFFWRFRKTLARRPASLLLALLCASFMFLASGCGSGVNSTLKETTPGSYQYMVTASSTGGPAITQTVTLNVTIVP